MLSLQNVDNYGVDKMLTNKMLVFDVKENSLAEKAGIEKGDYILEINGTKITNILEYTYLCADDKLKLMIQKAIVKLKL